ncbi:hypothetical protein G9C98_002943 [Cotesia typhae]|uniref:Uncharacterized protein n=1 Tax=Cotesia typhae TaxID=2053667 RepID=A0A8J5R8G2_9HYME|nr:hypothetical protein G9C98_002943 [Cotesia typhae]
MPRCLMAKKWKAYPWPDRQDDDEETGISNVETVQEKRKMAVEMEDEEIDVVGDSTSEGNRVNQQTCWGPHSPTAGTTAPSPPPLNASGALYYNAELAEPTSESSSEYYDQQQHSTSPLSPLQNVSRVQSRTKSLSMCFTSTGAALSLPPKKKDIYRPYSLQTNMEVLRTSPEEELSAAQAILDLSASPITASNSVFLHSLSLPPASSNSSIQSNTAPSESTPIPVSVQLPVPSHNVSNKQDRNSDSLSSDNDKLYPNNIVNNNNLRNNKTVAYTYEAFFVSDGRSKRRSNSVTVPEKETIQSDKPKFTCTECESACLRDEEMHVYSSDQILCDEERSPQLNRGL